MGRDVDTGAGDVEEGQMIDWIAMSFTLSGTFMQTRASVSILKWSFIVLTIGNLLWLAFALHNNIYSMVITGVMFGAMNVVAFIRWRDKR